MSDIEEDMSSARVDGGDGVVALTPAQAAQRASVVVLTVGMVELGGILIMVLFPALVGKGGGGISEGVRSLNGWMVVLGLSGLVYLLCGIPIRFRWGPAMWGGMVAACAQVIVFVMMVILGFAAGVRTGDPGTMTMGVVVFGTIASIHYFVLRWLWVAR